MAFKKQLRKIVTGLALGQEYICFAREELTSPLKVMLHLDDQTFPLDVTDTHLFLGYRPVIIGLYGEPEGELHKVLHQRNEIKLSFAWNDPGRNQNNTLATLTLRKVHEKILGTKTVFLFEANHGGHHFLNYFHRAANNLLEKVKKKKSGNVHLPGNLYEQVRIAYATPRIISVITLREGSRMNMFPTDLHGPVGTQYYVGSLRVGGLANEQVEQYKKIVISEVVASWFRQAYALGKNHMKPLVESVNFSLSPRMSETLNYPLPEAVLRYRELLRTDFVDIGIHRIHFYQVIHHQTVLESHATLAHIHQYYAQWRADHGLAAPWLIR